MGKPFVVVKWNDAQDHDGTWATEEELQDFGNELCEVLSYGYLIKKTRSYVTIAADFISPDTYGRAMKIPKKMITSIEELPLQTASGVDRQCQGPEAGK